MSKIIIKREYPDVNDFNDIFLIENITITDYNVIESKKYNRIKNVLNRNNITGFKGQKYKISSNIPRVHDTLSYFLQNKDLNYNTENNTYWDTLDLLMMRQKIDKKQRYYTLDYKTVPYEKQILSPRRFII